MAQRPSPIAREAIAIFLILYFNLTNGKFILATWTIRIGVVQGAFTIYILVITGNKLHHLGKFFFTFRPYSGVLPVLFNESVSFT